MIDALVGLRRVIVLMLWTVAAAFAFASAGSSGLAAPAPLPPLADLNPLLYPGTFRPDAKCTNNPGGCKLADITFTNPEKFAVNSWMIEIKGNPFKTVKLNGEPPCTSTGGKFGPNFETAWLCLGLKIPPGGTITGSLIATKPFTHTTTARFDWSNKGSAAGLLPDYSHDIPYYWIPAAAPTPAAKAAALIADAIALENDAIERLDKIHPGMNGTAVNNLREAAVGDLVSSVNELDDAGAALGSVDDLCKGAATLDAKAIGQIHRHDDSTGIRDIVHALADKRSALAIAQKAAAKK